MPKDRREMLTMCAARPARQFGGRKDRVCRERRPQELDVHQPLELRLAISRLELAQQGFKPEQLLMENVEGVGDARPKNKSRPRGNASIWRGLG